MYELNGNVDLRYLRRVEKVCKKLARVCNHIVFLKRCRDGGLVPKGLQLTFPVRSHKSKVIKTAAEQSLVCERLQFWQWKRMRLHETLNEHEDFIRRELPIEMAEKTWGMLMEVKDEEFNRFKVRQIRKFGCLQEMSLAMVRDRRSSFFDSVVNLSSCVLTDAEISLLAKGLKFAPTPNRVPVVEMVTAVEEIAPMLSEDQAGELRYEIKKILKKPIKPKDNLAYEERKAIRMLKSKENIVILKADKGNKTVVMDKREYTDKLNCALSDSCFVKVKKDPTDTEGRKLTKLLTEVERRGEITRAKRLSWTVKAPMCPVVYGLPKVHKDNVPLRTVFSFTNSPVYMVSKELSRILQPLQSCGNHQIKDTKQMIEILRGISIEDDELLVSYDVENLYGSVPAEEAAAMAMRRLEADPTLRDRTTMTMQSLSQLLDFCVKSTHFKCNGEVYKTTTCPIGSPLSSCLASIFMQEFEEKMLRNAPVSVILWKRYVDDTLVIVKRGTEDDFLEYLNRVHPSIAFTCEKEINGTIPFLDIRIKRGSDTMLTTTVYKKPTATDRYLDFHSCHCETVKWGVVSCLRKRAETICEGQDLHEEKLKLGDIFAKNGYPAHMVRRRLFQGRPVRREERDEGDAPILRVPYIPGVYHRIRGIAQRIGVKVLCTKSRTIGDMVSRPKLDKVETLDRGGVIYRQMCGDCDKCYVGETSRRARERKKEHEKDTREVNLRSAISEHCHKVSHRPNFDSFEIVEFESNWRRRRIKESIHIMRNKTFNRDCGLSIDRCWRTIIN